MYVRRIRKRQGDKYQPTSYGMQEIKQVSARIDRDLLIQEGYEVLTDEQVDEIRGAITQSKSDPTPKSEPEQNPTPDPKSEPAEAKISKGAQKLIDEVMLSDEDVATINGTGAGGSVLKKDVELFLTQNQ